MPANVKGIGMTLKDWKRRIAALEEHRRHQRPATEVVYHLMFVDREGGREWCNIATGPGDFICHRHANESLEEFRARADIEVLALKPRAPVGLVFGREEA
jgi:hypothetical protein